MQVYFTVWGIGFFYRYVGKWHVTFENEILNVINLIFALIWLAMI